MAYNTGASSGNLILIDKKVASTSASITFTSGISGYDTYRLTYEGVTVSASSDFLSIQFSTDGGANYSSTGYESVGWIDVGGVVTVVASTAISACLAFQPDTSSTNPIDGYCEIYHLANTSFNKRVLSNSTFPRSGVVTPSQTSNNWATTTAVNALKILMVNGATLNAGTFKLYGVQK